MATFVIRSFIVLTLILALCVGILWWQLSGGVTAWARSTLAGYGWSLQTLELERPTGPELHVNTLVLTGNGVTVTASDIDLRPLPSARAFLRVGKASLEVAGGASTADTTWQQITEVVPALLAIPVAAGRIDNIEWCGGECLTGQMAWTRTDDKLEMTFTVAPLLKRQLHGQASIQPESANFTLTGPGEYLAQITAGWSSNTSRITADASVDFQAHGSPPALQGESPFPFAIRVSSLSSTLHAALPLQSLVNVAAIQQNMVANGSLSAATSWMIQQEDITLSGNEPWQLTGEHTPARSRLRLDKDVTVTVTGIGLKLAHFTIGESAGCERQDGNIDCRLPGLSLTGLTAQDTELSAQLNVAHLSLANRTPSGEASGRLVIKERRHELVSAPVELAIDDDKLTVSATNAELLGVSAVALEISHDIETQQGAAKLDWQGPASGLLPLARRAGIDNLDIQGGAASASANLAFDLTKPDLLAQIDDVNATLSGTDWHLLWSSFEFEGGRFATDIEGWPMIRSTQPASMSWQTINIGVPVEDIALGFDVAFNPSRGQYAFTGRSFSGRTLGGVLSSEDYAYDIAGQTGHINLDVDGVQLGRVLALEKDEFEATGSIDGSVPVQIEEGTFSIEDGKLAAAAPGGVIRYNPGQTVKSMISDNQQMKLVLDALSNFHYSSLVSELDYTPEGNLIAHTSIQGRNPSYQQGREIHFTLNLEENVGTLLESLRLSNEVERRLEERARQGRTPDKESNE